MYLSYSLVVCSLYCFGTHVDIQLLLFADVYLPTYFSLFLSLFRCEFILTQLINYFDRLSIRIRNELLISGHKSFMHLLLNADNNEREFAYLVINISFVIR
jgi:hypothetical protein